MLPDDRDSLDGRVHRVVVDSFSGPLALFCADEAGRLRRGIDPEVLAAHGEAFRQAGIDAMTGLCAFDDPRRPLQRMVEAIDLAAPARPGEPAFHRGPELLRDVIRDLYLPTLPAPDLDPEDVAALEAAPFR